MFKNIKTAEQLATEKTEQLAEQIRVKRNKLITETDYLVMPDYPISSEQLADVKAYRQLLRDITEQAGYPDNIDWPKKPETLGSE